MYKKLALLGMIGLVTPVLAQSPSAHTPNFSGFNAALSVGWLNSKIKVDRNYQLVDSELDHSDMSTSGMLGGISLGYGRAMPNTLYWGIRLEGDWADAKGHLENYISSSTVSKLELKMKYHYGAYLIMGKVMQNVLPYIKGGITMGHWEAKAYSALGPEVQNSKDLTAWSIGLGSDYLVSRHFSIGAEYAYSEYNNFGLNHPKIVQYTMKPHTHTVKLNLRWYL